MKTILFVPHYSASLMTLIKIADKHREKKFRPLFFISNYIPDIEKCLDILRENDFKYVMESDLLSNAKVHKIFFAELIARPKKYIPFLKKENVGAIVSANDGNIYLLRAAKILGIKTIGIQWAHTSPRIDYDLRDVGKRLQYFRSKYGKRFANQLEIGWQIQYKLRKLIYRIFAYRIPEFLTDGMSDCYCVMGPYYGEMFNRQGTPLMKLIVTGHPEHDHLFNIRKKISQRFLVETKNNFDLEPNKKLIVWGREAIRFFDATPIEKDKDNIRIVLDILSEYFHDAEIALKTHPRDEVEYYNFIKYEYPFVKIYHDIDFYSLIATCDLYISQVSSTMNWAIALNKPTISYDFDNNISLQYGRQRQGIVRADTPEELKDAVKRCFKSPDESIFKNMAEARKMYMRLDGKATDRILAIAGV